MDNGACSYRRFLDGDETAFDDIMKELFFSLVFFINHYVHNLHTAEDIAMDTFTDLIVHKNRYDFKTSLKTYLFMVGRSRALNYIKRSKIISFTDIADINYLIDDENLPEKSAVHNERKFLIGNAIEKLPPKMREVICLIYFDDLTYDEAARIMKKNRKQVDNLLYRAKKELYAILGDEGKNLL